MVRQMDVFFVQRCLLFEAQTTSYLSKVVMM